MKNTYEEFVKKYRRLLFRHRLFIVCYFSVVLLAFFVGFAGIIGCGIRNTESYINVYAVLCLVVPVLMVLIYLIATATGKDKKRDALDSELVNSSLSADEIIQIGNELKINLFGVAVNKRVKELGLEYVPEWCVRDGVLPTAENTR